VFHERHSRLYQRFSTLLHNSEVMTTDDRRLISVEMCFMRETEGYILIDNKVNATELQVLPVPYFMQHYRKNWKEHIRRMSSGRIPEKYNISTQRKEIFRKTFKKIKRFCFLISIPGQVGLTLERVMIRMNYTMYLRVCKGLCLRHLILVFMP